MLVQHPARDQMISWIHIRDEVGLILMALDNPEAAGAINASSPEPVTMETFSKDLGHAMRRPVWAPGIPVAMKLVLGQRSEVVFASTNVITKRALELGYGFVFPEIQPALDNLLANG